MIPSIRGVLLAHRGVLLALLTFPATFVGSRASTPHQPRFELPGSEPQFLEFSPDSRVVAVGGESGGCIRDAATGRVRAILTTGDHGSPAIPATELSRPTFTPDGRRLIVEVGGLRFRPNSSKTLKVFDARTGRQRASFTRIGRDPQDWYFRREGLAEYALSSDGSTLAFVQTPFGAPGRVRVWSIGREADITELPGTTPFALSSDAKAIVAAVGERDAFEFRIWDVAEQRARATFSARPDGGMRYPPEGLAFAPDGKLLAVASITGPEVRDAATGILLAGLGSEIQPQAARFSPDARLLLLKRYEDSGIPEAIEWWNVAADPPLRGFRGPSVSFTPDGQRAAFAVFDRNSRWDPLARNNSVITLSDLPANRTRARIVGTNVGVATLSPDGRVVALPSWRIEEAWDRRLAQATNHLIRGFTGGPNRKVVEVDLRDARTDRTMGAIPLREGQDFAGPSLRFSPDGGTLAVLAKPRMMSSAGQGYVPIPGQVSDRGAEFWDVPPQRPLRPAITLSVALAGLALLVGRYLDLRRGRRARPHPVG